MNRFRPRRARRVVGAAVLSVLAGVGACYSPPAAEAAITTFTVSPAAGPPGTVVHVSGAGCNPGLLGSAETDFVSVSAPTLGVLVRVPVNASGSWSGSFTVPADAEPGASAPVAAVCVSGGLPSLTTIYTLQMFTVTAPGTTTPGTSTTTPGSAGKTPGSTTPATRPPAHPGTVFVPDYPSVVVGVPSGGALVSSDGGGRAIDAGPGGGGARVTITPGHSGDAGGSGKRSASAGPATLQQADLGFYAGSAGDGGLGWLGRLLLLALLIAAGGATFLIWRARRERKAATASETA